MNDRMEKIFLRLDREGEAPVSGPLVENALRRGELYRAHDGTVGIAKPRFNKAEQLWFDIRAQRPHACRRLIDPRLKIMQAALAGMEASQLDELGRAMVARGELVLYSDGRYRPGRLSFLSPEDQAEIGKPRKPDVVIHNKRIPSFEYYDVSGAVANEGIDMDFAIVVLTKRMLSEKWVTPRLVRQKPLKVGLSPEAEEILQERMQEFIACFCPPRLVGPPRRFSMLDVVGHIARSNGLRETMKWSIPPVPVGSDGF